MFVCCVLKLCQSPAAGSFSKILSLQWLLLSFFSFVLNYFFYFIYLFKFSAVKTNSPFRFSCWSFKFASINRILKKKMISSVSFAASLAPYHHTKSSNPYHHLLISPKPIQHKPSLHKFHGGKACCYSNFHSQYSKPPLVPASYTSPQRGHLVPLDAKNKGSGSGEEDSIGALETVLKLYSAIKNQNVRELSEIIDDECQCICNFFSYFQPLQGKKVHCNLHIIISGTPNYS